MTTEHPSNDLLREYIQGLLDEEQSRAIDAHLENCERCTDVLEEVSPENTSFVSVIQSAWDRENPDSSGSEMLETVDYNVTTFAARPGHQAVTSFGKYQVIDELGRGGMGVVYKALDGELKREVALKVIIAGEHSSGLQRERFRREAETIARLKHPGIVQIYEVGDFGDQPFLALELVPGPDLSEITKASPQPIRWSAAITLQLSQAIHFAHEHSIIHRDLKPSNVLVSLSESSDFHAVSGSGDFGKSQAMEIPVTKVTDFGIAKQLDADEQMTRTGHAMGTPAYMAPEQAAGKLQDIGPATDVYALGAILYELLTGQLPIQSTDPVGTLIAVVEQEPASVRSRRSEVPRDLETICMKCLMKRPEERYESARDLGRDLELFFSGEPILARPPGFLRRLYRWARNYPLLAVAYLGCVILYGLHLIAKHFLEVPFHTNGLGLYAPLLLLGWAGLTTACEVLARRFQQTEISQYGFMGISIVWMSSIFAFDMGPRTAPITMFFVFIAMAILIVPKSSMIWFVTLLCSICYAALALNAHFATGIGVVAPEEAIGFIGSLLVMGFCIQLILRRATRRTIRDDQWKTRSDVKRT